MLPFTAEIFFSLFEQYNRAIWPAQPVAYALGLAVLLMALRPFPASSRLIGALLAAAWLWNGVAYHLMHFAQINFWAFGFGALFVIQGLLFALTGALRGRVNFRFRTDLFGLTGLGFAMLAMVLDPLVGWLAGHGWAQVFGVAPGPTAIFTWGILLLAQARTPLHLTAIPLIWSLIAGTEAFLLDIREDFALPAAGLAGFCLVLWKNRQVALAAKP